MIEVEMLGGNAVAVTLPRIIEEGGFPALAAQIDALVAEHGSVRVMLNVSGLRGWAGWRAFREHIEFVRGHQRKVRRLAVITGPAWQSGLARILRIVVSPRVKVFGREEIDAARRWLRGEAEAG